MYRILESGGEVEIIHHSQGHIESFELYQHREVETL